MVVGIAGPARAGKDTAAAHLAFLLGLETASFADPIRQMLNLGLGLAPGQLLEEEKDKVDPTYLTSPRFMAQTLGTEWGRQMINPDIWVIAMERHLVQRYEFKRSIPGFVIPDVRFENEAAFVRKQGVLIYIERAQVAAIDNPGHVSERGIARQPEDIVIQNNGSFDDLHRALAVVADTLPAGH